MSDGENGNSDRLEKALTAMRRQIRRLTVAVVLMMLALVLLAAGVYGSLINYFDGDAMLFGGATIAAAFVGFLFGWFTRGRGRRGP